MLNKKTGLHPRQKRDAGFTLVELMIAVAMFTVISGAAFSLLAQHQPIFNQQQNLAEVNIALRNAVAQMELDVANAGANYYASVNIPNYPVGVVITNNVEASGGDCRTGTPLAYSTNCFDQMSIITADINTPPTTPSNSTGACASTTSSGNATAYLAPTTSPTTGYGSGASGLAAATAAATNYKYNSGTNPDQILFVKNDGSLYTTAKLAAAATTATIGSNYYVLLTFGGTSTATAGLNTASNDPYGMSTHDNSMLTNSFCSSNVDYVLRIVPITYKVDLTTPTNPTLLRQVAGQTQTIAQQTLATQIIGFKIGASLFNNVNDTDTTTYGFDASNYNNGTAVPYNFTLVRSVMVSLIGRTNPNPGPAYVFQNSFDSGNYEIQGVSVVINPRNMSMSD